MKTNIRLFSFAAVFGIFICALINPADAQAQDNDIRRAFDYTKKRLNVTFRSSNSVQIASKNVDAGKGGLCGMMIVLERNGASVPFDNRYLIDFKDLDANRVRFDGQKIWLETTGASRRIQHIGYSADGPQGGRYPDCDAQGTRCSHISDINQVSLHTYDTQTNGPGLVKSLKYLIEACGGKRESFSPSAPKESSAAPRRKQKSRADYYNACIGMTRYDTYCHNVDDPDLKNLCIANSGQGQDTFCYNIADADLKNLCLANAVPEYDTFCYNIGNQDIKNTCLAASNRDNKDMCYNVSSEPWRSFCGGLALSKSNCYNLN